MLINGKNFKFGADPELFVEKDGKPISAFGMIPGNKLTPYKVSDGAVQVDGMALEFNIDPVEDFPSWESHITSVMGTLEKMIPKDHSIVIKSTAEFGMEYIKSQPMEARELGCSSDFNAYTGDVNPKPNEEFDFRTSAGHIHIGWSDGINPFDAEHFDLCRKVVKCLDVTLGLPSVILDHDKKRRSMYGSAGSFRPKPYGVEYRVLSNFWLKTRELRKFAFGGTIAGINHSFGKNIFEDFSEDIVNILNKGEAEQASKLYRKFGGELHV